MLDFALGVSVTVVAVTTGLLLLVGRRPLAGLRWRTFAVLALLLCTAAWALTVSSPVPMFVGVAIAILALLGPRRWFAIGAFFFGSLIVATAVYGGRFVQMPEGMGLVLPTRLRPFIATDMFSPLEKLRIGLDLFQPRDGHGGDVSVGEFLRRRLGDALVERLAGPLLGGVYGTPIDELSLDAVVPQLREAERLHRSLLLASLTSGRAAKVRGSGSPFVSLAGGMGQLTEALVGAIARSGEVDVRMNSKVVSLERHGGGFDARLANGELLRPEAAVLASPGPATAGLLDTFAPAAAAHVRAIAHGSTAVVSLGYRLDQFTKPPVGHGFLVAAGEPLVIDGCTISSLKWAGRAPDGTVLLRVFVGSHSPGALAGSDAEIVALVERDLSQVAGVHGAPILARVARSIDQMPKYTVGHLERVAGANEALAGLPNLVIVGAAFCGVGVPDCIAQGRAAAARVGEALSGVGRAGAE